MAKERGDMEEIEKESLKKILSSYKSKSSELIPILLEVQANFGYLPEEAILLIARFLDITEGKIYSLASFYAQFRLTPLGRQQVAICRGTACHIRGAPKLLDEIEETIGIKEGETTSDREYTLETVACIGCCALAPCLRINNNVHGEVTPERARKLFHNVNKGEQGAQ